MVRQRQRLEGEPLRLEHGEESLRHRGTRTRHHAATLQGLPALRVGALALPPPRQLDHAGERSTHHEAGQGGAGLRRVVDDQRALAAARAAAARAAGQRAATSRCPCRARRTRSPARRAPAQGAAARRRPPARRAAGCALHSTRAASMRCAATATGTRARRWISSGSSPTWSALLAAFTIARRAIGAAVAARHHAGRVAALAQQFQQRDHGGCLAGAADQQVAHHDQRSRCPLARTQPAREQRALPAVSAR